MILRKKVKCPLKAFEVEHTEEFKRLTDEGWAVVGTVFDEINLSVTFYMEKEETKQFPNGDANKT